MKVSSLEGIIFILVCLVTIDLLILLARRFDASAWRRTLVAYRLILPTSLKTEDVAYWLALVRGATETKHFPLQKRPPVAVEIRAAKGGISIYLLAPWTQRRQLLANVRAALPGARLEAAPDSFETRPKFRWASEATLTSQQRPLRNELAQMASVALLAALQPLTGSDTVFIQWFILGGSVPPKWWPNAEPDTDDLRAVRVKQTAPVLRAAARIGVRSSDKRRRATVFKAVWGALRTLDRSDVQFRRKWQVPAFLAASRLNRIALPLVHWPLTFNTLELSGLLGMAAGGRHLPGLSRGSSQQVPPAPGLASSGAVFGVSNFPGMTSRRVAVRTNDRLRHTWVVGPTGSGKSTLLANLVVQDMRAGAGLVVVDARGDLVPDILARVPENRREDVIVIDPSETARPIGFNILRLAGNDEQARELAVQHVLHIFEGLWRAYWGPRTADIMRCGLLTLAAARAPDGSAFTLCELYELLTNHSFRRYVTGQPGATAGVLGSFWQGYERMTDAERQHAIGPSLNKLRAFLTSSSLRLLLGQSDGIDLTDVFRKRRIVLVRLNKGTLGSETAQLAGSLLIASLWQVTMGRGRIPAVQRRPAWLYVDEFQETVRLPIDLADMLAQARGFGLGLTLAHQHLGQLPERAKEAVMATARTQVLFQLDYDDAKVMERRFTPLTQQDLSGLGPFEIAMRPCLDGVTADVVTATTLPLPEATTDAHELAAVSQERYGVVRSEVEAAIAARVKADTVQPGYGRTSGRSA